MISSFAYDAADALQALDLQQSHERGRQEWTPAYYEDVANIVQQALERDARFATERANTESTRRQRKALWRESEAGGPVPF